MTLEADLKQKLRSAGAANVGIARAVPDLASDRLIDWLARGRHGEMSYMERQLPARRNPQLVLADAKSVIMLAFAYHAEQATNGVHAPVIPAVKPQSAAETSGNSVLRGKIAHYAQSEDYHEAIRVALKPALSEFSRQFPEARFRLVVDSAPLMERDYAQLAGLGWIGKNTLLLQPQLGSWFVLAGILTTLDLQPDEPFLANHCGSCTACLDACPTQAFDGPYQLDARRCISYQTIEHKSAIEHSLRPMMEDWLFGCDVCQQVCPWNSPKFGVSQDELVTLNLGTRHDESEKSIQHVSLADWLTMSNDQFTNMAAGTPLLRTGLVRMQRNAVIVAGNSGDRSMLEPLQQLDANTTEPILREAIDWAITQINSTASPRDLNATTKWAEKIHSARKRS